MPAAQPASVQTPPSDAKTVWLIDDDETSLIMAEMVLTEAGFTVRTFTDSEQALATAQSAMPDLIVVDVVMPRLDGFEFCSQLRRLPRATEVPILVTTSLDDRPSIERAYRCGATNFATKPINWEIEAHRLRYLLRAAATAAQQKRLESDLRQTQKMEAIGVLAGGIAHDFNNILTAISGYTELATLESLPPAAGDSLQKVLRACRRASDLVGQILLFARRQEKHHQLLDPGSVVDEAVRLLRAALPSTIRFDLQLAPGLPPLLADATQIHQVVMNLCTNAAHAMKDRPGSRLGVMLARCEVDRALAERHPGLAPGPYVCLTVTDNGHGMTRATLDRIFEPFFTTKPPGQGTGLGLSVVHGIVKDHGGLIAVESQPELGTSFRVYFPVATTTATAPALPPAPHLPSGRGEKVLVVDDEQEIADLVGVMLRKSGYTVRTRTNSIAAFDEIVAGSERYDVVVTDLTMPGMTGLELARRVAGIAAAPRLILISGNSSSLSAEQLQAAGFKAVLAKPLTLSALSQAVDRVLHPSS